MFLARVKYLNLNICLKPEKYLFLGLSERNSFSTSTVNQDNKSFNSSNRQGKIMAKFYGERMVGRKKRWFPTHDPSSVNYNPKAVNGIIPNFGISTGKAHKGGKSNTRRLAVLNKLFMQHITSMLATGETSERILNRGLQVTKVKTSIDYTNINVYWLGSGVPNDDAELELELRRCSGLLRHELSQLELMGVVPRIHFVRDRSNANMVKVDATLDGLDSSSFTSNTAKSELFGQQQLEPVDVKDELPEMRNDVFGLNHHDILMRILSKMRKSKQAWQTHSRQSHAQEEESSTKDQRYKI